MGGGGSAADRVLRTLLGAGAIGSWTDARLVERFATGTGQDREDAFTALVGRHGPMVRGVCRRMLADPADADDAFQAVFLVLARKAGSLRRAEGLRPWLHGVAVRVAKESRGRSERIKAREGAALVDVPGPAVRDDLFELRAAVDEELNRLPKRHREPILLCDLEGAPRHEAARRLGLAEGTLSSRLARGRSLLRDRLTRRGLTVGALVPLFPDPGAPALGPLADVAVRRALAFTTRGAVPAGLASLAEGVLHMLAASKLKSALLAGVFVLTAVGLTAGLARGFGGGEEPQAAPAVKEPKPQPPRTLEARGVVVDERGRPIAGAEVRLDPYSIRERVGATDAEGAFAIPAPDDAFDRMAILVRAEGAGDDDGVKLGFFRYDGNLTPQEAEAPVRIVAERPGGVFTVIVSNGPDRVAGATVEAAAPHAILGRATTDANGNAFIYVPKNTKTNWLVARKDGVGFDYMELGDPDPNGLPGPGVAGQNYSSLHLLGLRGSRTFRVRALEPDGAPAVGVPFVARIRKDGYKRTFTPVLNNSRLLSATTDAEGIATFDWLPTAAEELGIGARSDRHAGASIKVDDGQTEATIKLVRLETIRGRVRLPDGSPAAGTRVVADGKGTTTGPSWTEARADDNGFYEMKAQPNASYVVMADSRDLPVAARFGVDVDPGKPAEGVDLQFDRGTILRGTVTVDPDDRPAPGQRVRVAPLGRLLGDSSREVYSFLTQSVFTDDQGRYEFRLSRGNYALLGPNRDRRENVAIEGVEKVRDIRLDRIEVGYLRGLVIAEPTGEPVPGATVSMETTAPDFVGFANMQGRFETRRPLGPVKVRANNSDRSLAAVMEVGADVTDVIIKLAPTATATGVLLGPDGEIAKGEEIPWGRVVETEWRDGRLRSFHNDGLRTVTDDQGRFTLSGLIVGERREIGMIRNNKFLKAGVVQPEKPGRIDLGTLRAEALEAGRPFP